MNPQYPSKLPSIPIETLVEIAGRCLDGMVSIDETMNMLYARVGREQMETTITKLFGGEDPTKPIKEVGHQGGEIDFQRYWEVVVREQQKRFNDSDLGKVVSEKKKKRAPR